MRILHKVLILSFGFLGSTQTFANECPDLSGVFSCPAHGSQAAAIWMSVQSTTDEITTYKSLWSFGYSSEDQASDAGEMTTDGYLIKCEGNKRLFGDPTNWRNATTTFVNSAGDVESYVHNQLVNTCRRVVIP